MDGLDLIEQRYTANIVNISVFNALSIGGGPIAAVLLCVKRGDNFTSYLYKQFREKQLQFERYTKSYK